MSHISVMLAESINNLDIKDFGIYVDATFGMGGHSRQILLSNQSVKLISIDRDGSVSKYAKSLKNEFPDRFTFVNAKFSEISDILDSMKIEKVDGFLFDFGVSSMQLDDRERGFSIYQEAPLDMRMDQSCNLTAYDVVNTFSEIELSKIINLYGEEERHKKIAKEICNLRLTKKIKTTTELANLITSIYKKEKNGKIHVATKTFQAIRIFLNSELIEIENAIKSAINRLNNCGRIVTITFHSLEDKIIKDAFKEATGPRQKLNKYAKVEFDNSSMRCFAVLTKKPIIPTDEEILLNPRSRSAKMRVILKVN